MVELHRQNFKENKKLYNEVVKKIRSKIPDLPMDHVGSTALPYMYGKNIIDVLIGVDDDAKIDMYANILMELGYFPGSHNTGNYRFFANTMEETKMGDVHIHLAYIDTDRYKDFLILRDYLLQNKEERKAYSDLKKRLIKDGTSLRKDYKKEKSEYVSALLERARNYYK